MRIIKNGFQRKIKTTTIYEIMIKKKSRRIVNYTFIIYLGADESVSTGLGLIAIANTVIKRG